MVDFLPKVWQTCGWQCCQWLVVLPAMQCSLDMPQISSRVWIRPEDNIEKRFLLFLHIGVISTVECIISACIRKCLYLAGSRVSKSVVENSQKMMQKFEMMIQHHCYCLLNSLCQGNVLFITKTTNMTTTMNTLTGKTSAS